MKCRSARMAVRGQSPLHLTMSALVYLDEHRRRQCGIRHAQMHSPGVSEWLGRSRARMRDGIQLEYWESR